MDVLKLAVKDKRRAPPDVTDGERARYEVDPDQLYPAALKYLGEAVAGDVDYPDFLAQYVEPARTLPAEAFAMAAHVDAVAKHPILRAQRAQALELARLAFTALLRDAAGGPIGLRIRASDRWRL